MVSHKRSSSRFAICFPTDVEDEIKITSILSPRGVDLIETSASSASGQKLPIVYSVSPSRSFESSSMFWCCTMVLNLVYLGHEVQRWMISLVPRDSYAILAMCCSWTFCSRSSVLGVEVKLMRTGMMFKHGPITCSTSALSTLRPEMTCPKTTSFLAEKEARTTPHAAFRRVAKVIPEGVTDKSGIMRLHVR